MYNSEFGHLLTGAINSIAAYEAKTAAAVETELGVRMGVAPSTVQRYKSGHLPPDGMMVESLAEEAVRRGYLNREWLVKFLRAARYPALNDCVERLFPAHPAAAAPARIYQNLPAPTYNQFVMRAQAYADVMDGLQQRSAVVLISSLGGMGKTSLAREVAAQCLVSAGSAPGFEAVVWVSDKGREGATNLSMVLDEIARTLDYSGLTSLAFEDRRYEVEQLLRRQRVLLVIDNFETITDGALLSWLLSLPEPSKALVTSREYHPGLRSSWPVDLRGMSKGEAEEFVGNQLRFLRMDSLVDHPSELEPLCDVTGGNPKAIMIALGLEMEDAPVHCHHNYISWERHFGQNVMVTRKGAVRAAEGMLGIIPGSMGARTYIVRGLGNRDSFCSCSHGAGRAMSRTAALQKFTVEQHAASTAGVECDKTAGTLDETPGAYKDIEAVMAAQTDLIEPVARLKQFLCVKGIGEKSR